MAKTKIHGEYLDPSVISGQTQVTAVGADSMLVFDATDNALKKALLSDLIETVGSTPSFTSATISGDLTVDTTTLKVDSSNNRVGIGTSSPASKLTLSDTSSNSIVQTRFINDARNYALGVHGGVSDSFVLYDETAGATRLVVDTLGNLLVGKTTGASATAGHRFNPNGSQESTASGTQPLYLNRLSSDGNIIVFDKDNSTVGSIGSEGGDALFIQGGTTSGSGLVFHPSSAFIAPARNGVKIDATIDLGKSTHRFKNLYLSAMAKAETVDIETSIGPSLNFSSTYNYSPNRDWRFIVNNFGASNWGGFSLEKSTGQQGTPSVAVFGIDGAGNMGVGIGGAAGAASQPAAKLDVGGTIRTDTGILFGTDTAAANRLDDYEEGTWTPVLKNTGGTTATHSAQVGNYTKIGNTVHVHGTIQCSSGANTGGTVIIDGLPFAALSGGGKRNVGQLGAMQGCGGTAERCRLVIDPGNSYIFIIRQDGQGYDHNPGFNSAINMYGFSAVYSTA